MRTSHDLAERRILEIGEAARLVCGQEQIPQARFARARLQLLDDRMNGPGSEPLGLLIEAAFVRIDVLGHELLDAAGEFGAARALGDVHGVTLRNRLSISSGSASTLATPRSHEKVPPNLAGAAGLPRPPENERRPPIPSGRLQPMKRGSRTPLIRSSVMAKKLPPSRPSFGKARQVDPTDRGKADQTISVRGRLRVQQQRAFAGPEVEGVDPALKSENRASCL